MENDVNKDKIKISSLEYKINNLKINNSYFENEIKELEMRNYSLKKQNYYILKYIEIFIHKKIQCPYILYKLK